MLSDVACAIGDCAIGDIGNIRCHSRTRKPTAHFCHSWYPRERLMIRAVIFEFSGILAKHDPTHIDALQPAAEEEGPAFDEDEYMELDRV